MMLVVGGRDNGKKDFVLSLGYSEEDVSDSFETTIIYKLNDTVKKCLEQGIDVNEYIIKNITNKHIIICDEVGNGIVPMAKEDREYREAVGRVCCILAKNADTVYRVYCGIATKIKG